MAEQVDHVQTPGERPAYVAPRAMRMAHTPTGKGDCAPQGSGDVECMVGNTAANYCDQSGSDALVCAYSGNSAYTQCYFVGADPLSDCIDGHGVM